MLITKKIVVDNSKPIFSYKDLLVTFIKSIHKGNTSYSFAYGMCEKCLSIILSRKMHEFLSWKPWIKTVNIYKWTNTLLNEFGFQGFDTYYYGVKPSRRVNKYDRNNDLKIKVLYELYELGFMYEIWQDIPEDILHLMVLHLEIDSFMDELFERSIKRKSEYIFSIDPEEKKHSPYFSSNSKLEAARRYRARVHQNLIDREAAAQELYLYTTSGTASTFMTTASGGTTADVSSTSDYNTAHTFSSNFNVYIDHNSSNDEFVARRISFNGRTYDSGDGTARGE